MSCTFSKSAAATRRKAIISADRCRQLHFVVHPDDLQRVQAALAATFDHNAPYDIEFRIVRPDKTERTIHTQAESTLDETGKVVRITGTTHDITERKTAERLARDELCRTQAQLEVIGRIGQSKALMAGDVEAIAAKLPNWRRSPPVASASTSGCSMTPRPNCAASIFSKRRPPATRPA
jgi:hypothetical protein